MLMDEQGMPAAVWDSKAAYTYPAPMTMVLTGAFHKAHRQHGTAAQRAPRPAQGAAGVFCGKLMTHKNGHHR